MKIAFSEFVRRQTKRSSHSYTTLSDRRVISLVESNFHRARPGYRRGVVLVPVPCEGFFTATVQLQEGDLLEGGFFPRVSGEMPRKGLRACKGGKSPAKYVEIVLYSRETLEEDGDVSSGADWEIVSINASLGEGPEPIPMDALLYNHFHVSGSNDGGTSMPETSPEEFVEMLRESFLYWRDKTSAPRKRRFLSRWI